MSAELYQIADAALADAYRRAGVGTGRAPGEWMACRPGCHACCVGVFAISTLDAQRLQSAMSVASADVADRIRVRADASRERLQQGFPGDFATGKLFTEEGHEEAFEDFANDEPCPVLDPATGTCDLYAVRPLPCRTFGPPMPNDEGGLGVCELCFVDAPAEEVARCAVDVSFLAIEEREIAASGDDSRTLIAFALR